MYTLAERLGHPLSVIMAMTMEEYNHWFTFLRLQQQRAKKNGGR